MAHSSRSRKAFLKDSFIMFFLVPVLRGRRGRGAVGVLQVDVALLFLPVLVATSVSPGAAGAGQAGEASILWDMHITEGWRKEVLTYPWACSPHASITAPDPPSGDPAC
jgi:hypothetical protein